MVTMALRMSEAAAKLAERVASLEQGLLQPRARCHLWEDRGGVGMALARLEWQDAPADEVALSHENSSI